ncbi:MAG: 4Fe-4S cluster-binding domain-containing protein [Lachnospiraceae bacterium]|nr:4Fe-4S cluster-binding domain-containing protein [Lachnospiraceae bacterium]
MTDCTLCPRKCHVNRLAGQTGYCGQTADLTAARASLHMWEEPCISGTGGSGTVFFSGCNVKCTFCQNHSIAVGKAGSKISTETLGEIFLSLQEQGAHNVNLVTAGHFVPQVCIALEWAKARGLNVPIVYNTGSYESVETLKMLDGLVDVYLPDLKYYSSALSGLYSHAADYFAVATEAIGEMFRQVGHPVFMQQYCEHPENSGCRNDMSAPVKGIPCLMTRGVIVRHLLLPGQTKDSKKILRYLHETYGNDIYISIMNQYTPLPHVTHIPELNRKVTAEEYDRVMQFALRIGIENGFFQEGEAASESFIPQFDGTGLL